MTVSARKNSKSWTILHHTSTLVRQKLELLRDISMTYMLAKTNDTPCIKISSIHNSQCSTSIAYIIAYAYA